MHYKVVNSVFIAGEKSSFVTETACISADGRLSQHGGHCLRQALQFFYLLKIVNNLCVRSRQVGFSKKERREEVCWVVVDLFVVLYMK